MVLKNLISERVFPFLFFFQCSENEVPLKHKCLMELDRDQNRNAESRICLRLFSALVSNER